MHSSFNYIGWFKIFIYGIIAPSIISFGIYYTFSIAIKQAVKEALKETILETLKKTNNKIKDFIIKIN